MTTTATTEVSTTQHSRPASSVNDILRTKFVFLPELGTENLAVEVRPAQVRKGYNPYNHILGRS
jgi:hypothetical protein